MDHAYGWMGFRMGGGMWVWTVNCVIAIKDNAWNSRRTPRKAMTFAPEERGGPGA
jgi:hypothetical protein